MFVLHSSNKTENLVAHLAAIIRASPLAAPLAPEVLLIQGQGMERWLSQQLANQLGVWGNYQFLFPIRFFNALAKQVGLSVPDTAFDRDRLAWLLEGLLRNRETTHECKLLRDYLQGSDTALKRYQLAQQLAHLFDQYQIMRPDMLAQWEQGRLLYHTETETWQRALWCSITRAIGQPHRGQWWQAVIGALNAATPGELSGQLPERIGVFGINHMPPLFMACLQGLSRHCQVHFFLLNPARHYWADLAGKRRATDTETVLEGHPLLVALGQQGREFQALLLEQVRFELELDSFEAAEGASTLQRLQNDMLNNQLGAGPPTHDHSISVHACHSRLREVEVLKDLLLQALAEDTALALRDMVVMAPDINVYQPFISAVFDDIPHAIADRSLGLDNKLAAIFVQFLTLSQSRFGWREVLDCLGQPEVFSSFGLSAADLEQINYWLRETGVRWGRSAAHQRELGLPECQENTWQATLDRLLMGYAVGDDGDFVDGVLPYRNIEGLSASALGGLDDFMRWLSAAADELKIPCTRQAWTQRLLGHAEKLFSSAETDERLGLNEVLIELSADLAGATDFAGEGQVDGEPIELVVIVSWLSGKLAERKSSQGFLRGQLTFCALLPMRSIPFKIIALMGMNEGEFPTMDRPATFDLLAGHFRPGDRSSRADDRYQFLEILLSARRRLLLTYTGQSISNNELTPPSVVVSELLDVLNNHYQQENALIFHPLHAFSPKNFAGGKELYSYSTGDLAIAKSLTKPRQAEDPPAVWWQGSVPHKPGVIIELSDLLAFFRNPQAHFFARRLGLRLQEVAAMAEEREPFQPEFFDLYTIRQQWVASLLAGQGFPLDKLKAQGRWPLGPLGALEYAKHQPLVEQFAHSVQRLSLGQALPDEPIDLDLGRARLVGKLGNRQQRGALFYRCSPLKGKDFINAWLQHLIGNQIRPQTTWLLAQDEAIEFKPGLCQPGALLAWLDVYLQGQTRPDAFFVEAALAYVKAQAGDAAALAKANQCLAAALEKPYEAALRQLYRHKQRHTPPGTQDILGDSFAKQCDALLRPVWQATHAAAD